jgi:hypothetical protein
MGRKSKLTPDTQKRLLDLIRAGVPRKRAAEACDIGESTFWEWMAEKQSFRSGVEKAYGECVASKVLRVRKAEDGAWQAAAWWLERMEWQDFGRRDRVENTGPGGGPMQHEHAVDLKALPTHDLKELRRMQLAATKNGDGSGGG